MLVSDISTRVKRVFGDDGGVQINDQDIIRWTNDAMREIVLTLGLNRSSATLSSVANQATYTLPARVTLHNVKYKGLELRYLSQQEADQQFPDADAATIATGTPMYYWVWGESLRLYPAPSVAVTNGLTILLTKNYTDVTVVGDTPGIPDQYHNRIVEYCLAQAYQLDDNVEMYDRKNREFAEGVVSSKSNSEWVQQEFYPMMTSTEESTESYGI